MNSPIDREPHTGYRVWFIEKLIINFAMPMDFVYHSFRAIFQHDTSQTPYERLRGLWSGKVAKYQKLLRVKDEMGEIPEDWREICMQTPCGKVRYFLACISNSNRRRPKYQGAGLPSDEVESEARQATRSTALVGQGMGDRV